MKIHAYTDKTNLTKYQQGQNFTAWAKGSLAKPAAAFIHVSFYVHDMLEINERGRTYLVRGKDRT
jgi:hypothetical protein